MRVAIAFDHRGVVLRPRVIAELEELGHEIVDLGTDSPTPRIDYPDKAREVGEAIVDDRADRALLICSSGVGAAIAACKIDGVRAAVCHDIYSAHQGVEHDDMNVLCLGSEIVGGELAGELIGSFLAARFNAGARYVRRLEKIARLERHSDVRTAHDISVPIRAEMPIYDGNPGVQLESHSSIAEGATANVSRLELGVHTGTHVDAPLHFIDGGPGSESLELESMLGPAVVVDATSLEGHLDAEALERLGVPDGAVRILFKTSNSRLWESDTFSRDFVRLTGSGARLLIERGVELVGIDYLSIGDEDAHRELLGAGVTALEGLDLREVAPGHYDLVCLPLRLEGSDGAPARAILLG